MLLYIIVSLLIQSAIEAASPKIHGVNLGGWFVLEKWLTPSLFPSNINDEWELSAHLNRTNQTHVLRQHWATYYTRQDFMSIKRSGFNLVRIPVGYWTFVPAEGFKEPYLNPGCLDYIHSAMSWADEVGLMVMLDLHGHPGSQNGFDNSGHQGPAKWLHTPGTLEWSLDTLYNILLQFRRYTSLHSVQIINEPINWGLPMDRLLVFYDRAYSLVREMAPEVKVVFHDAFLGLDYWRAFMKKYDQAVMDIHIYHVFDDEKLKLDYNGHLDLARRDGVRLREAGYPVVVGEWSLATATCEEWKDNRCVKEKGWHDHDPAYMQFARDLAQLQISEYARNGVGEIFWNYKMEPRWPEWDYQAARDLGWF